MSNVLQLQEAKAKLSQVIAAAIKGQPQIITKHGEEAAVIISYSEFRRLQSKQENFVEFLLSSPLAGSDLDLTREDSLPRPEPEL